jgi:hypothetical protein
MEVTIIGENTVGAVLTANPTGFGPGEVTYTYQWLRGNNPIPNATKSSYRAVAADTGHKLTVQVTAHKAGYSDVVVSAATSTSIATKAIARIGKKGSRLVAQTPWDWRRLAVDGVIASRVSGYRFTYQWYRGDSKVVGATSRSYRITPADLGQNIQVEVTINHPGWEDDQIVKSGPHLVQAD